MVDFVNLHCQTSFSLLDSLIEPIELFKRAKELQQSSVAITDHGSLASVWKAYKVSKDIGVKLIIGCELYFQENTDDKLRHIILLARNATGYKNLLTLNRKGFDESGFVGKKVYSVVNWVLLEKYSDGLICLTACGNGIVSQLLSSGKIDEAEKTLLRLKSIYQDNLGIEIQANNMERNQSFFSEKIDQKFLNRKLIDFGKKHNIKVVATSNSHYLLKEEHKIHDVLLAIGSHQPIYSNFRLKYNVPDFYLKSGEEIKSFFSRNFGEEFAQSVCDNSVYFANLCEMPDWIDPKYSNPTGKELPSFDVTNEVDYSEFLEWKKTVDDSFNKLADDSLYLRFKSFQNLDLFFHKNKLDENKKQEYIDRVEEELDTLDYCGVSSYMLIVADYIAWGKANGVSVGPGRGSVGGCFVGHLLGIHDADSIKYGLVFPRFHNKIKKSYSDIDVDFSQKTRHKILKYITDKYGEDNVAHVSNINRITPKVYVKDIARSCELGGSREEAVKIGESAADCIPSEYHSIEEALEKSPLFAEYCKKYPEFEINKNICNKYRAWSTHAAGLIISKRPLTGLVPVRKDKDGAVAIEFDKDTAEEVGLVKMDILGLSNLDVIDSTIELIRKSGKEVPDINFEEYDEKTYDLISSGNTFGVFQFGKSGGTIDLCRKIKPKSMEDLAIITTLARPASREIREDFIKTREGKKPVNYAHPLLQRAFETTYGFPLYDESLLILAKDVAGWDLDEADKLRKLTKEKGKNPEKVRKWKKEFIEGCLKNKLSEPEALTIWTDIVEPFGKYSFNKSHAILYSILTYKTAYLKAHFPVEFLLANLMLELNSNTDEASDNIARIKLELRENNVKILSPDINKSSLDYSLFNDNKLLTGLNALKFVGEEAIEEIISKRPFKSFYDFMSRLDTKKVRSNAIQALAATGALDSFGIDRKLIFLYCSDYRKKLQVWMKKHDHLSEEFSYPWSTEASWSLSELYALEHEYLGEAFICKPYEAYGNFFKEPHRIVKDIKKSPNKTKLYPIKGIIKDFFAFNVKKEKSKYYGQEMIKATIEDRFGEQCSCTIFPDRWKVVQEKIKYINKKAVFDCGLALSFSGTVNIYDDEVGIILEDIYDISIIPQKPADLKSKKINLKSFKISDLESKSNEELFETIEDCLYDSGLLDID